MKILWLGLEHHLGENAHQVLIMNKSDFKMDIVKMFDPDIIIEREFNDGVHLWGEEVGELKKWKPEIKTAVWLIDTHVGHERHKNYIKNFDFVFMAISEFADEFQSYHPHVYWLPLCFPSPVLPKNEKNIYPIGFVGRVIPEMRRRVDLLDRLKDHYAGRFYAVTDYEHVYQTMSSCTIMVNQSFANDLNFRVFEALACGNILVTNSVPDIEKIQTLKDRVYIFHDPKGAIPLIDSLLMAAPDGEAYRQIEDNRTFIAENHMIQHRVNRMIDIIIQGGTSETLSY